MNSKKQIEEVVEMHMMYTNNLKKVAFKRMKDHAIRNVELLNKEWINSDNVFFARMKCVQEDMQMVRDVIGAENARDLEKCNSMLYTLLYNYKKNIAQFDKEDVKGSINYIIDLFYPNIED